MKTNGSLWLAVLTLLTTAAGCRTQALAPSNDGSVRDGATGDLARAPGDLSLADLASVLTNAPTNHRSDDSQCSTTPAAGDCTIGGGAGICSTDSACTMGTNGRCVESMGGALFCSCSYDSCMHDGDCPSDQLCACHGSAFVGGSGNSCVMGNCRVDTDCGAHGYCSPSHGSTGCGGLTGYYCHTSSDQCLNDSDCTAGAQVCAWSVTDNHWECQRQLLCP